jgi:hypothetical protein
MSNASGFGLGGWKTALRLLLGQTPLGSLSKDRSNETAVETAEEQLICTPVYTYILYYHKTLVPVMGTHVAVGRNRVGI